MYAIIVKIINAIIMGNIAQIVKEMHLQTLMTVLYVNAIKDGLLILLLAPVMFVDLFKLLSQ